MTTVPASAAMNDLGAAWAAAMRRGAFDAAHAISDTVLAARDPATRDDPALPYHLRWVWDGRAPDGRHVLVRCYHGLGDTIQFARFLPLLARRAATVTVEAQPALLPLLRQLGGIAGLIPFRPDRPTPPSECDLEIMELAHALRLGPAAAPPSYFRSRPHRPGAGFNVGLCWQAGGWDPARSVPEAAVRAACDVPGARLLSLHRPPGSDVAATASTIAGLGLVVTVDTMVAHLAGALGRETWVLLRRTCDWRWMDQRDDSPWYPSARLYRQHDEGNWAAPLARLKADLRVKAAAAAG